MKVILSRKGFDSSSGGKPSPILDGQMLSIPIPEGWSEVHYDKIGFEHSGKPVSYRTLMDDLNIRQFSECHLDPDIRRELHSELPEGWKPAFGQSSGQATELKDVEPGDLFLFFGSFRKVHHVKGHFTFVNGSPEIHAIWGYLEVGHVYRWEGASDTEAPIGYDWHPHLKTPWIRADKNVLFTPAKSSTWFNGVDGCGTFRYSEQIVLSQFNNKNRLKSWWKPIDGLVHKGKRIKVENLAGQTFWNSGGRGQEFIFEVKDEGRLKAWLENIVIH